MCRVQSLSQAARVEHSWPFTIAVQLIQDYKTGTSTAYPPANTQPTACSRNKLFKNKASECDSSSFLC